MADRPRRVGRNRARAPDSVLATGKAVASGEKLYGVVVDFVPIRAKAKGSPVEFVFPASGVSAVTEPVEWRSFSSALQSQITADRSPNSPEEEEEEDPDRLPGRPSDPRRGMVQARGAGWRARGSRAGCDRGARHRARSPRSCGRRG